MVNQLASLNMAETTAQFWSHLGANYASSEVHKSGPSLAKVLSLARPQVADHCLDVGTGTGHTAAALAPYVKEVVGLDPAAGMLEAARVTYGHLTNLGFVQATSEQTGFADNTFDIITARHTLHHHPDISKTLAELGRVLKAGGRLVIVDEITPNDSVADWYHQLEVTRDPTHHRAYTMAEWQVFIARAGLSWIVGDSQTCYSIDVASWIERMKPSTQQAEAVRELFRTAPDSARRTFDIRYEQGEAVRFTMPMMVMLATKD
jgi:SAM-dependent methyltransferase